MKWEVVVVTKQGLSFYGINWEVVVVVVTKQVLFLLQNKLGDGGGFKSGVVLV